MKNNHLARLIYSARTLLFKYFLCPFGYHDDFYHGKKTNFCGGCSKQMNANAYGRYLVKVKDGSFEKVVDAVNEQHAASQVMYQTDKLMICGETGKALGQLKYHRENLDVKRLE